MRQADRRSASALACWLFICRQARRDVFVLSRPDALLGGAGGTRTPDFRLAKAALSQLSYGPPVLEVEGERLVQPPASNFQGWWAILDSNQGPRSYQDRALTG
jgi:hypothetical protein